MQPTNQSVELTEQYVLKQGLRWALDKHANGSIWATVTTLDLRLQLCYVEVWPRNFVWPWLVAKEIIHTANNAAITS